MTDIPIIPPPGEASITLRAGPGDDLHVQRRIWELAECAGQWEAVHEAVPGMNTLTLLFDPERTEPEILEARLRAAWPRCEGKDAPGREVEIPVHYGGELGPDLAAVAAHAGLQPAQVVALHAAAEYRVFCLGFLPGFAYLGRLDPRLATPRRAEPRVSVAAGSVGIGGAQTGIYPIASPGGWQVIGRTELPLFEPEGDPPNRLQPGDRVRFVAAGIEP